MAVLLVAGGFSAAPAFGQAVEIESPRARRVREQQEDNKRWKREAEARESELYDEAQSYYKSKQYRKAAEYYKKVLDLRYYQWDLDEVGQGRYRTIEPASDRDRRRLDTSRTRNARRMLETIGEKVRDEWMKDARKAMDELEEQAEVAEMLEENAKAYLIYGRLIELTERIGDTKDSVKTRLAAMKKQDAIRSEIAKPLDEAEKLLADGKPDQAYEKIEQFEREYEELFAIMPDLEARVTELKNSPVLAEQDREQEVMRKILAGDAALMRNDYLSAERYYRDAATMYPEVKAKEIAAKKLAGMLKDPRVMEAMEEQRVRRECRPLLARAEHKMLWGELEEAKQVCDQIIEIHPETEWADQARDILKRIHEKEMNAAAEAEAEAKADDVE